MKYLLFVLNQHWRILVILALFAIATTAGFMGVFKPKREPRWIHGTGTVVHVTNDWNVQAYPIQTNSNFHRLNLGGKASDFTDQITELACRASLAGLAIGINRGSEGYEALSNKIWAIYHEH